MIFILTFSNEFIHCISKIHKYITTHLIYTDLFQDS